MRISLNTAIFCPTCECVTDNATTCDCGATLNLTPMAGWMERNTIRPANQCRECLRIGSHSMGCAFAIAQRFQKKMAERFPPMMRESRKMEDK